MEFSIQLLVFLFIAAAIASFMDTLAGGGGLITIPALIVAGVPPLAALGTNKLQSSMGSGTASFLLLRRKKIFWKDVKPLMLMAFAGSVVGSIIVQFVNTGALEIIIPLVLLLIAVYFISAPYFQITTSQPRLSSHAYKNTAIPLIGAYDGMFGPGTGSFFAAAGVSLRALELVKATATAKPLNFATNIASLLIFILAGQIVWAAGLVMMTGQVIGAWLGSHYLFKLDPKILRILIVTLCLVMLGQYGYRQFIF